jgi:hypothetical protein
MFGYSHGSGEIFSTFYSRPGADFCAGLFYAVGGRMVLPKILRIFHRKSPGSWGWGGAPGFCMTEGVEIALRHTKDA